MDQYSLYDLLMAFGTGILLIALGSCFGVLGWLVLVGCVFLIATVFETFVRLFEFALAYWPFIGGTFAAFLLLAIYAARESNIGSGRDGSKNAKQFHDLATEDTNRAKLDRKIAAMNTNQLHSLDRRKAKRTRGRLK